MAPRQNEAPATSSREAEERDASSGLSSARRSEQGSARQTESKQQKQPQNIAIQVEDHMKDIRSRSKRIIDDRVKGDDGFDPSIKFRSDWRSIQGHSVPARFRLQDPPPPQPKRKDAEESDPDPQAERAAKQARKAELDEYKLKPYTDYSGLRFPTLETAESYHYHQDKGLDKLVERSYPIQVPPHRRLDPYLREYIHFLHRLDPARFSISRIAERYRLRTKTVEKIVQEWSANSWMTRSGLTTLNTKQATKESVVLDKKEAMYAKWVGYDQLGDEEDPQTDDEEIGEFKGWRPTSDWVRKQTIEVEMMSAFPMMEKRSPMPKKVDVDMTLHESRSHKVINWIDPTDHLAN